MQQTGETSRERWRLGRRPALDGLRGIAVLLVVPTHFDQGQWTNGGVLGVKLFFVLSGFLITSLLIEEHQQTGRVSLRGFYRRRALRLFPALAVMVLIVSILTLAGWPTGVTSGMVAAICGYVSNWYLMLTADGQVIHWGALGHTWSLAIEEQFYLAWPLVVIFALRRGRHAVLAVAAAGGAASLAWLGVSRHAMLDSGVSAWCLLSGCALAAFMTGRRVSNPPKWLAGVALLALVPLVIEGGPWARLAGHIVAPVAGCLVIWTATQVRVAWLEVAWLTWVGERSYGLYLWHAVVGYLCFEVPGPWLLTSAVGIAVSFALTVLSRRYVEGPCLRLKRRSLSLTGGELVPDGTV